MGALHFERRVLFLEDPAVKVQKVRRCQYWEGTYWEIRHTPTKRRQTCPRHASGNIVIWCDEDIHHHHHHHHHHIHTHIYICIYYRNNFSLLILHWGILDVGFHFDGIYWYLHFWVWFTVPGFSWGILGCREKPDGKQHLADGWAIFVKVCISLGNLLRPHYDLTGILVSKGNHFQIISLISG